MSYQNGPPKIVTDGLVLMLDPIISKSYPGSGNTLYDLSGRGNNGTINGASYLSDGRGSFNFDGINQNMTITNNSLYQFTNTQPFTLSAWVKWRGDSNVSIISYASSGSRGFYLTLIHSAVSRTNSFFFDYYDGSAFRGTLGNSDVIPTNTWAHIAATSSTNSVNDMHVYVNGSLVGRTIRGSGSPSSIDYSSLPLNIGSRASSAYFNGQMSHICIYNKALSVDEINQNYNATKYRFGL